MSQLWRAPACLVASATLSIAPIVPIAEAAPPEVAPVSENVPASDPAAPEPIAPPQSDPGADESAAPTQSDPPPAAAEPNDGELPSWNAELPSYDQPLLLPEPTPNLHDGNGLTVIGAMLFGGGVVLATSSGVLMAIDSDELGLWIAGAALSGVAIGAGIGLLTAGVVKRKRYKPWRLQHDAPAQGTGMLAGGTLALSAGAFAMVLGGVALPLQDDDDLPYGQVVLSLGAVSVATGVGLLIVGIKRGRAFDAWHQAKFTPTFSLLASPESRQALQWQTAGATFGVAGRF